MRTVAFLEEEVTRLATPFAHTLIGRFSVKRPSMDIIEQTYLAPGHFQGQVSIGARDHRSICIRFALEEDYRKAWSRPTWRMGDAVMHTSRWTPHMASTSRGRSQATIPLWIGFPGLPAHLFTPTTLQSLAAAVGTFIRLDPGVAVFNRPGYARVCVEVDLLEPLHRTILIQNGDELFPQPVIYERLPQFCTRCTILGHTLQTCRSVTHSVGPMPFRSALPSLSYDEYIIDLGKGVGDRRPRAPPQTSTRPVATVEMQMEPPPLPSAKVVIPTTRVSSVALKTSSTSRKGKKKKTKRTPESHTTTQVTPQPLQTSNSFDVLVGLTETEISAPTTGMDSHHIAASPLHGPSQTPTRDHHPSRLTTAPSPITHPPLHRLASPTSPPALSTRRTPPSSPPTTTVHFHTHTPPILHSHISDLPTLVEGDSDILDLGRTSIAEPLSESLTLPPLPPCSSHFPPLDHSSDIHTSRATIGTLSTDGVTIGIPPTSSPSREGEARQSSAPLGHIETPCSQDCLTNCQTIWLPSSHTEDTDSPSMHVHEEGDSETSYDSLEEDYDPTTGYQTEGSASRPPRRSPYSTRSRSRSTTH